MTDYSGWTDEQVNEAIAKAKGRTHPADFIDYTHDWRLCGELLEETMNGTPVDVGNVTDGYMVSWGCSYDIICRDLKRAICEAWLAWKEQG
jgi:hypothetical protein